MQRQLRNPVPNVSLFEESKTFTDSLIANGVDTILVYHKQHGMYLRSYYIFWKGEQLEVRLINENGIFNLNSWDMVGLYRNERLFEFYQKHEKELNQSTIPEASISHYPYVDIAVIIDPKLLELHLPWGVISSFDSSPYQFARLIESILFNIEQSTYWEKDEKNVLLKNSKN
ncbi:hypothetical protein [Owenweeksia hongkongensis]|uniref:Uncharacterized protein n=1 Tax=Owenweeksia hongkongensis (strain DSM 17368 / CIP 108786 / JCM 12287 / NRRL B-23963 / UST20020801) TaxID=926562 RepID=G8R445_OWEHD|nr:hypothetical protein [Owenweeksia hongkongensis]AEV33112.1 hypothetical protein Oweho_2138 [Owenweeksia hongkongensis DSM 17368]